MDDPAPDYIWFRNLSCTLLYKSKGGYETDKAVLCAQSPEAAAKSQGHMFNKSELRPYSEELWTAYLNFENNQRRRYTQTVKEFETLRKGIIQQQLELIPEENQHAN